MINYLRGKLRTMLKPQDVLDSRRQGITPNSVERSYSTDLHGRTDGRHRQSARTPALSGEATGNMAAHKLRELRDIFVQLSANGIVGDQAAFARRVHGVIEELEDGLQGVSRATPATLPVKLRPNGITGSVQEILARNKGRLGNGTIAGLVQSSQLLKGLRRAGIDTLECRSYKDEFKEIAEYLGTNINALNGYLRTFRWAVSSNAGKICYRPPGGDPSRNAQARHARQQLQHHLRQLDKWNIFEISPRLDKREFFRYTWEHTVADNERAGFVCGNWLNCYIYAVLEDHLDRYDCKRDLFSDLKVRIPDDLLAGSCRAQRAIEFDVLAQFEYAGSRRIVWIECKTSVPARIKAHELTQRKHVLDLVMERMGEGDMKPDALCVALPAKDEEREVWQKLGDDLDRGGITLVDVSQFRATIRERYTNGKARSEHTCE